MHSHSLNQAQDLYEGNSATTPAAAELVTPTDIDVLGSISSSSAVTTVSSSSAAASAGSTPLPGSTASLHNPAGTAAAGGSGGTSSGSGRTATRYTTVATAEGTHGQRLLAGTANGRLRWLDPEEGLLADIYCRPLSRVQVSTCILCKLPGNACCAHVTQPQDHACHLKEGCRPIPCVCVLLKMGCLDLSQTGACTVCVRGFCSCCYANLDCCTSLAYDAITFLCWVTVEGPKLIPGSQSICLDMLSCLSSTRCRPSLLPHLQCRPQAPSPQYPAAPAGLQLALRLGKLLWQMQGLGSLCATGRPMTTASLLWPLFRST